MKQQPQQPLQFQHKSSGDDDLPSDSVTQAQRTVQVTSNNNNQSHRGISAKLHFDSLPSTIATHRITIRDATYAKVLLLFFSAFDFIMKNNMVLFLSEKEKGEIFGKEHSLFVVNLDVPDMVYGLNCFLLILIFNAHDTCHH